LEIQAWEIQAKGQKLLEFPVDIQGFLSILRFSIGIPKGLVCGKNRGNLRKPRETGQKTDKKMII